MPGLPPVVIPRQPSIMAPLLIELCLQTAGLWELTVMHRMMIPDGIDHIARLTDVESDDGIPLAAVVSPRREHGGRTVFDAQVIDPSGLIHLEVRGYRTTEFSHPIDDRAAGRIREALGNNGIAQ